MGKFEAIGSVVGSFIGAIIAGVVICYFNTSYWCLLNPFFCYFAGSYIGKKIDKK